MWKHVRGGMLLAALGLIPVGLPATPASAQFFSRGCNNSASLPNKSRTRPRPRIFECRVRIGASITVVAEVARLRI